MLLIWIQIAEIGYGTGPCSAIFFVDPNPHYKKLGQKAGMKDKKLNALVIFCFVFESKLEKRIVHIFSKLIMFLCEKA